MKNPQPSDPKLYQGQLVEFNAGDLCHGVGKICGTAAIGEAIIGRPYIIEVISSNIDKKTYPYSHIVIFECMIEPTESVTLFESKSSKEI